MGLSSAGSSPANDDSGAPFTTNEDTAVTTGNVLANDTDPDGDTLSVDSFTQGTNGTVSYNGDGTFTYTPGADFHGTDTFTYTVDDGNGNTDTATVSVTVNEGQDAPTAEADSVTTNEDSPVTTGNVLANDSHRLPQMVQLERADVMAIDLDRSIRHVACRRPAGADDRRHARPEHPVGLRPRYRNP